MRGARTVRLALAVGGVLLAATLTACGGGGGGGSAPAPTNQAPVANAGPDQTTVGGGTVTLNGTGSSDADGTVSTFSWSQTAGPAVTLNSTSTSNPVFCAPTVAGAAVLTFALSVTDNGGLASAAADTVNVTVSPNPGGLVSLNGRITFARVPLHAPPSPPSSGLNYMGTRQDPARGISVQAMCGAQLVIAGTTTNANGDYSINVPADTQIAIRANAEMVSAAPQWHFRVIDDANANQIHAFTSDFFNSSTPNAAQNVAIPSGWSLAGTLQASRSAAPFAILDTAYTAVLAVLQVEPTASFPLLDIDWGPSNEGGETFFRSGPGTPTIVLSGEANVDTDEYDQHVIAHEFGHYVENRFSRSDSIGGAHGAGDRLDLRVAFGEGYGYAFAGIVLGDPVARDTFGPNQATAGNFNIEQNAVSNPGWYSEASNWAILWDLFDAANDAPDTLTLGFAPLWEVLANTQRNTDAVTSIFSFVSALKQQQGGVQEAQINQIVNGQSIASANIEPFGGNEINDAGSPDVLPVFTTITVGGMPQTVRSIGSFPSSQGSQGNKLSNHRFLRLNLQQAQNVRFRVEAVQPARDVDIAVFQRGILRALEQSPTNEDFTIQNLPAGDYVLDVYDCENAECADQPSYNYQPTDITVTLSNN